MLDIPSTARETVMTVAVRAGLNRRPGNAISRMRGRPLRDKSWGHSDATRSSQDGRLLANRLYMSLTTTRRCGKRCLICFMVTKKRATAFSNGPEFLETADIRAPGCLVLDFRMPGGTGLDLQERLSLAGSRASRDLSNGSCGHTDECKGDEGRGHGLYHQAFRRSGSS